MTSFSVRENTIEIVTLIDHLWLPKPDLSSLVALWYKIYTLTGITTPLVQSKHVLLRTWAVAVKPPNNADRGTSSKDNYLVSRSLDNLS